MNQGYRRNRLTVDIVFTDGACPGNGQRGASAGWGFFWPKSGVEGCGRVPGQQSNNRAELYAVYRALQVALDQDHPPDVVIVKTDSDLLIKTMTDYIYRWQRNNWQTTNRTPVKNRDVVEWIDDLQNEFNEVIYEYVPAHSGIVPNEVADSLARDGARMPYNCENIQY
ncbi:unnamed protein product [Caenorhabditis angaria]|uniref:ribonuclease H n=1 Tax=Caenorhabditis angaria TaxID=860376 RepID=A0A9P1IHX2_9PELO|nr:unnamed protein product [Caenorhabditis angaria]